MRHAICFACGALHAIHDGVRKTIALSVDLADERHLPGWRQLQHLLKNITQITREIGRLAARKGPHYKRRMEKPYRQLLQQTGRILRRAQDFREQDASATAAFRRALRRHSGVEAAMGAFKAGNGLKRCRDKTELGFERYLALGVFGRKPPSFGRSPRCGLLKIQQTAQGFLRFWVSVGGPVLHWRQPPSSRICLLPSSGRSYRPLLADFTCHPGNHPRRSRAWECRGRTAIALGRAVLLVVSCSFVA